MPIQEVDMKDYLTELEILIDLYFRLEHACDDLLAAAETDGLARTANQTTAIADLLPQIQEQKLRVNSIVPHP